ncbi:Death on curing protein, Doc toxin [Lunatimonas lonarensis]|uniref:Death on curing protein, Doc toxin n=1 Tax=Lunatimonas lonarensis TaxID=1232681 RepID=R7ZV81_9BACT|nr:type II toxin-antitoxin system death-on-curing family toxin [Lunatimonas lonarensis]EON78041.1 Death on curing protein, Doc toxin [Lunatimonas lonarensis]
MIDYQEILEIHQVLIREFGGSQGVRDENGLKSALERPFSGFGEKEFYPNPEEKAGAILESIVKNHPFIDGNKRTGYVFMRLVLMNFGKDIQATQDEKYDLVIAVASGKLDFQEIVTWIKQRTMDR